MKKIILSMVLLVVSYTNAQNTLIVDNNVFIDDSPSHVFTSFAAALAAASNGDTILIQPSATSYGNINITKSITVKGMGYAPVLNNGESSYIGSASINASNIKLTGMNISGGIAGGSGISNLLVEDCYIGSVSLNGTGNSNHTFRGNVILAQIYLNATNTNSMNFTFTNNLIQNLNNYSLYNFNDTTIFNNNTIIADRAHVSYVTFNNPNNLVCQNNIWVFTSNSFSAVNQSGAVPVIHNNSLTYHYGSPTITALNGTGNLDNQNPFFANIPANNPYWAADNDYNLGASSAGNDAGTDGNDVGIYNGYYDFDMRGYPTELPYLTEMSISNNMVPAGSNLSVNLKANANKTN
ncbi:hypothetical protein [Xanthomarina sp. GH4-25]|uniref:hypothetical protein n=1 Tax=Xanthomarina sp. GH4-25 TaxID=3349335 RepID=UPI000D67CB90|nr:hypothetical protein DI383_08285 [Flavobacteriaceae bacterium LYZ1037]